MPDTVPTPRLPALARALLVAAALLSAGPARAEEDPQRAKELYQQARQLLEQGQVRESLLKLQEAYEAFPSDAILVSIANRHLDLGEPEEAAQVLSRIQPSNARLKKEVTRLREDVEARLAEPVTVSVSADAQGAEVSIDGGAWRELPSRVQLPRGSHRFSVRAPGRREVTVTQELRGSQPVPLIVDLPVEVGTWRLVLEPLRALEGVRVRFEGEMVTLMAEERLQAVSDAREARPGTYRLTCMEGVDREATTTVTVAAGQETIATCRFPVEPVRSGPSPWAWVSAGGAAAALAGGTYYLVSYLGEKRDYSDDRYEIKSTKPLASGVLYGTGVGLGVLSAFLFAD